MGGFAVCFDDRAIFRQTLSEGAWQWVDGTALYAPPYVAWRGDEPNGAFAQNCLAVDPDIGSSDNNWVDRSCADALPFVCDLPAGAVIACPTALIDGVQRAACVQQRIALDAAAECALAGGTLATVRSEEAGIALDQFLEATSPGTAWWLGGNDVDFEGFWVWADGTLLDSVD